MIEIVIAVLAVLVVGALVWARIGSARSETRSVETYEHALDVLGEVSKRTESTGFRILPHEETGRAHVGPPVEEQGNEAPRRPIARQSGPGPLASKRLPPAGQPKLRFSGPGRAGGREDVATGRAGQPGEADPDAGSPAAADGHFKAPGGRLPAVPAAGPRYGGPRQSNFDRRRQVMNRRVATGGAAAIAVAAVVVAAVLLTGPGGHAGKATTTTLRQSGGSKPGGAHSPGGSSTTTIPATSTTIPTSIKPVSVTSSNVSFAAPSGAYTLAFQAVGGACWVGIEHSSAGPWLFAETLAAGRSASFKASGGLVVTLGAPGHIELDVNGLVAELPGGVTQPYNVDLTPSS